MIIGIDEAGRGALAGPLSVTALTLLYPSFSLANPPFKDEVKDSKELTPQKRLALYEEIMKSPFILFSHVFVSNFFIDKKGINAAFFVGAKKVIASLFQNPLLENKEHIVIVDGKLPIPGLFPQRTEVKADKKYLVCALASIVSKVKRDIFMEKLERKCPGYFFAAHKGYGTLKHRKKKKKRGPTPYHRLTFLDSML